MVITFGQFHPMTFDLIKAGLVALTGKEPLARQTASHIGWYDFVFKENDLCVISIKLTQHGTQVNMSTVATELYSDVLLSWYRNDDLTPMKAAYRKAVRREMMK